MSNTFTWTDETVLEFINNFKYLAISERHLQDFKASKEPKKEWEIVAFLCEGEVFDIARDGQKRDTNPAFTDGRSYFGLSEAMQPENNCAIWSVHRLSGDITLTREETVVSLRGGKHIIRAFTIVGNDMIAIFDTGRLNIKFLSKLPTPLFTTLDGVDLVDGDEFWATRYNRMDIVNPYKACFKTKEWFTAEKGYRLFSTREAAETYIVNNKPCLSVEDVRSICAKGRSFVGTTWLVSELTNLVKSNL